MSNYTAQKEIFSPTHCLLLCLLSSHPALIVPLFVPGFALVCLLVSSFFTSAKSCFGGRPTLERNLLPHFPVIKPQHTEEIAAPGLLAIILAHL